MTSIEISNAHKILDIVTQEAPEVLFHLDEISEGTKKANKPDISLELIQEIVKWDKKNKRLKDFEYRFMADLAEGKKSLSERNVFIAGLNLEKIRKYGFGK